MAQPLTDSSSLNTSQQILDVKHVDESQLGNFMYKPIKWIRDPGDFETVRKILAIIAAAVLSLTGFGLIVVIPGAIEWNRQTKMMNESKIAAEAGAKKEKEKEAAIIEAKAKPVDDLSTLPNTPLGQTAGKVIGKTEVVGTLNGSAFNYPITIEKCESPFGVRFVAYAEVNGIKKEAGSVWCQIDLEENDHLLIYDLNPYPKIGGVGEILLQVAMEYGYMETDAYELGVAVIAKGNSHCYFSKQGFSIERDLDPDTRFQDADPKEWRSLTVDEIDKKFGPCKTKNYQIQTEREKAEAEKRDPNTEHLGPMRMELYRRDEWKNRIEQNSLTIQKNPYSRIDVRKTWIPKPVS